MALMRSSLSVSVELSVTICFGLGFLLLLHGIVDAARVGFVLAAVTVVSLAAFSLILATPPSIWELGRSSVALVAILYVLTPVLASLATPISDDTLGIVVLLLLIMHVFSYDYFARTWSEFRAPASANLGLLSAVFLCSRMPTHLGAMSVVSLGLLAFALWPIFSTHLCAHSDRMAPLLAAFLCPTTGLALYLFLSHFDPTRMWLFFLFLGLLISLNVAAPFLFARLQLRRHRLAGQWSEAH